MNDANRTAIIRAKLKYPTLESFVSGYASNISKFGIFFKTASPRPEGLQVKFELTIADGTVVLRGFGEVAWTRQQEDGARPAGMGIRFLKIDSVSKETLRKILIHKKKTAEHAHSRYSEAPSAMESEPDNEMTSTSHDIPEVAPATLPSKKRRRHEVNLQEVDSLLDDIVTGGASTRSSRRRAPMQETPIISEETEKQRQQEETKRRKHEETARRQQEEAERREREEAEQRQREEAEQRQREEAEQRQREEAEQRQREEAMAPVTEEDQLRLRAKAAENRIRAEQKAARIEADEEEIDDLIAAFDTIQMPDAEPEIPAPQPTMDAPVNVDTSSGHAADPPLHSKEEEDSDLMAILDSEPDEAPDLMDILASEDEDDDDDEGGITRIPLSDTLKQPFHETADHDLPFDLNSNNNDNTDDGIVIGVPGLRDSTSDSDLFLDEDPYMINESNAEMDLEMSTTINADILQDLANLEDLEDLDSDVNYIDADLAILEESGPIETLSGEDRIGDLIEDLTRDSIHREPISGENLFGQEGDVRNSLDDIFDGEVRSASPISERQRRLEQVSEAPETLPDDALPDDLAMLVQQRRSLPPPAPPPFNLSMLEQETTDVETLTAPEPDKKKGLFGKLFKK